MLKLKVNLNTLLLHVNKLCELATKVDRCIRIVAYCEQNMALNLEMLKQNEDMLSRVINKTSCLIAADLCRKILNVTNEMRLVELGDLKQSKQVVLEYLRKLATEN